jgi:hypothetical protein
VDQALAELNVQRCVERIQRPVFQNADTVRIGQARSMLVAVGVERAERNLDLAVVKPSPYAADKMSQVPAVPIPAA